MKKEATSEPRYCRNCHYPLPPLGAYCPHCSQKYTTGKVTIGQLLRDFFEAVFNIDSKIFRTLGALFIPGKLTIEYFKGRHKRYMNPLRLFFIMTIILVATISFLADDTLRSAFQRFEEQLTRNAHEALFIDSLEAKKAKILEQHRQHPILVEAFDSLSNHFEHNQDSDTLKYGYFRFHGFDSITLEEVPIATWDLVEMENDALLDHYGVEDFWGRVTIGQIAKINKEGASFTKYLIGQVIWMVLGMMIALAFILKLLYIRRKRYYVEHLIFSFHHHAFAFFVCSLGLVLDNAFFKEMNYLFAIAMFFTLIYLFWAMKRVYQQGLVKTFFKYWFLNFAYVFIFVLFLGLTVVISAFFY